MDKNTFVQLAKDAYGLTVLFPSREPLRYKIREIADDVVACFILKKNDFLGDLKAQLELIDSFFEIALSQDWTSAARINEVKEGYLLAARTLLETDAVGPRESEKEVQIQKRTDFVIIESFANNKIANPMPLGVMEPVLPGKPMIAPQIVVPMVAEAENGVPGDRAGVDENENQNSGVLTSSQILRQNRIIEFLKERGGAQVWEIQKIFPKVSKRTIRRDFHSMLKQGLIERTGERNMTGYKMKTTLS